MNYYLFELNNVEVKSSKKIILENITFKIKHLEHTAILGPNGAGKTSLMKLMTGDIHPASNQTSSTFKIFGQPKYNIWDVKQQMGIITSNLHERYRINGSHLTGLEVVLSGYHDSIGYIRYDEINDENIEKAFQLMDQLNISYLSDQCFSEMSSGESRKTLIARALVNNPKVLMLDEPTNGLDIKAKFNFLDFTKKIMQENHTLIVITHHVDEILPSTNNVILIRDGKIFKQGPKEKILKSDTMRELYRTDVSLQLSNDGTYYFTR